MFTKLGRFVVHNPWKVIAAWVVAAVAVIAFAPTLADVTTKDQAELLPSKYESVQAQKLAADAFGQTNDATASIVVKRNAGGVLTAADQAKVTAMVQSGKAEAMAVDLPPAIAAVELTSGSLELLGDQYDSAPYGFVLPKDETDFGGAIVEALKALEADGTYKTILAKWKAEGGSISDFAVNPSVG